MYNNTIKALEIILEEKYDKANPDAALRELVTAKQLVTIEKGEVILYQKDPVKYFYLLLSGRTVIMNHIAWSIDNIIDYVEPPHILGLVEYLLDIPTYTASVIAETPCVLFRIAASEFIQLIRSNNNLCYSTVVVMGKVSHCNMNCAETHRVFHPKDMLGYYLFMQAKHSVPYIYPFTRKALSEELNINLRSLHRYINYMQECGYLTIRKGKIVIEQKHLDNLATRYGDVIL